MRAVLATALAVLAALAAPASAAPPATVTAGQLTVGVSLPSEGFQVGVVVGSNVIYARGLEIDLARELSGRLELQGTAFVQSPFEALLSGGPKGWDVAIAQITITPARAADVDFSTGYLRVDQGVLASQYLRSTPRRLSALRSLRLCAQRGTTSADAIARRIKPRRSPRLLADVPTLMLELQLGRCDAVVADLPMLATLKSRAPRRYGAIAGRVRTSERYGIALPKGSALTARVNAALAAMASDGTLGRLQQKWLDVQIARVRILR